MGHNTASLNYGNLPHPLTTKSKQLSRMQAELQFQSNDNEKTQQQNLRLFQWESPFANEPVENEIWQETLGFHQDPAFKHMAHCLSSDRQPPRARGEWQDTVGQCSKAGETSFLPKSFSSSLSASAWGVFPQKS